MCSCELTAHTYLVTWALEHGGELLPEMLLATRQSLHPHDSPHCPVMRLRYIPHYFAVLVMYIGSYELFDALYHSMGHTLPVGSSIICRCPYC